MKKLLLYVIALIAITFYFYSVHNVISDSDADKAIKAMEVGQ